MKLPKPHPDGPILLQSEFARIRVQLEESNGPRLLIVDQRSGARIYLDPLELEALALSTHADLAPLMDPDRFHRYETD